MPKFIPFKTNEVDDQRFYKIPKSLFNNPQYADMTLESKIVYAILRDRMELSKVNGWHNENEEIYLLYSRENLAQIVGCSVRTIQRTMAHLIELNLIREVRQGLCRPNIIYVGHVDLTVDNTLMCKIGTSGHDNLASVDKSNWHTNDTDNNNTNLNETEKKLSHQIKDLPDKFSLQQETKDIANYFFDKYKSMTGKNHPKIKKEYAEKLNNLVETELVYDDDHDREIMISSDSIYEMIDLYFDTEYNLRTGGTADHKMFHFLSDGVLKVLAYRMI